MVSLFRAERRHRVDARRTPRGERTGYESGHREYRRNRGKRHEIILVCVIEQRRHHAGEGDRPEKAGEEANRDQPCALLDHHSDHHAALGAERHPHADHTTGGGQQQRLAQEQMDELSRASAERGTHGELARPAGSPAQDEVRNVWHRRPTRQVPQPPEASTRAPRTGRRFPCEAAARRGAVRSRRRVLFADSSPQCVARARRAPPVPREMTDRSSASR